MDDQAAFVESTPEEPRVRSVKAIKLPLKEDGSIDWESTSGKHTQAFIDAIKTDPNGILDNIKEEAGSKTPDDEPSGIADATVLAAANAIMVVEALGVTTIGPKFAPVLSNLHPLVAIKACSITEEEIKPVMPACKRIIKRYVPIEYLGAEYQDIAIVAQHLMKLSAQKFKDCIDLAMEIEARRASPQRNKVNGHNVTIDATPAA